MPKTQVGIVGGGPSGPPLSQRLYRAGEQYSESACARVWKATRFSWWFMTLTQRFSDDPLSHELQLAELDYLAESEAVSNAVAENYTEQTPKAP